MESEHKVVVTGRDRQISFPSYCPNCNGPASGRLPVQKVFTRSSSSGGLGGGDDGTFKTVTSFKIPFCTACIQLHRKEEEPLTWQNYLTAFLLGGMLIVPAGYIFLLSLNSWREFLAALMSADLFLIVIYGGLNLLSLGVVTSLFIASRFLSRPHLVVPPTSITRAVDFSDGHGVRTFRFRHAGYAEHFRQANRKRLRSPDPSGAGIPWRWIFRLFLLGAVAVAVWWLLMQGML